MKVVEMSCLRSICGVRRIDRVRNVDVRRRCGKNVGVGERMDQGVLRWFGHVERMGEERLVKRVYESDVRGVRPRGRPRACWMDEVKDHCKEGALASKKQKNACKIGVSGAAYVGGDDVLLVGSRCSNMKRRMLWKRTALGARPRATA